jgi:hypothetical protein
VIAEVKAGECIGDGLTRRHEATKGGDSIEGERIISFPKTSSPETPAYNIMGLVEFSSVANGPVRILDFSNLPSKPDGATVLLLSNMPEKYCSRCSTHVLVSLSFQNSYKPIEIMIYLEFSSLIHQASQAK